mgnify:CR=1 FL=1
MERIKEFTEAYDRRHEDPEKNYGIHGIDLRMILKGPLGAVQFVLYTQRMLKHVQQELVDKYVTDEDEKITLMLYTDKFGENWLDELREYQEFINHFDNEHRTIFCPFAVDLGYHSPVPRWEGQTAIGSTRRKPGEFIHEDFGDGVLHKMPVWEDVPEAEWPKCDYLDNCPCYYDGSSLNAEPVYQILLSFGEEAVWKYLEDYYHETFSPKQLTDGEEITRSGGE